MSISPRQVFDSFQAHLHRFITKTDAEIEDQFFDRKEIPKPTAGNNVRQTAIRELKEHIKETVSAFANTNAEGGLLVLGISKSGEMRGINHLTENQRNELSHIGQLLRHQSASVRWESCTDRDGTENRLLLIYVPETRDAICETLEAIPRAWKRAGAQNIALTERDREQLRRDKRIDLFERRPATRFAQDAVDPTLLAEIRDTWSNVTGVDLSDRDLLHELGAVETTHSDPVFTNAGLLFFASNPQRAMPQAQIRILRYESKHDDPSHGDPTLDRTFTGSITAQLRNVREFLRESGLIRVYHIRRQDGGFEEKPELPFIAVDEAIVNAVAHRDYALEWGIECTYYQDALEVRNPGRLLQRNGSVPASFRLDERTLQSTPRNPTLLNWLRQARDQKGQQFVRALSEGTRAMLRAMTELNLPPPEYNVTDSETVVRLRIDTSSRESPSDRTSEFANLYSLSSSGALPNDWKKSALVVFRDRLQASGWFVDHVSHGRLYAHQRGSEFPTSSAVRAIVRLYPAYVFSFRSIQGRPYLVIDYAVEVKSVLTLAQLGRRGHDHAEYVGRGVTARMQDGWRDAYMEAVGAGNARLSIRNPDRTETVALDAIIPHLRPKEIRAEVAATSFDLPSEIKRRSLATTTGAARKRAEVTQITAEDLANHIFPLRVGGSELVLDPNPVRLDQISGLQPRTLAEPLVEFARHRETSNIREGITEFGAYSQGDMEIELVPIVFEDHRAHMQALIERLKAGKYKYKGSERTFGARFSYASILALHSTDRTVDVCKRILSEHPDWAGDESLRRLFLVHAPEAGFALDDEHSPYYEVKRFLLEAGVPCQMVDTPTLLDPNWKDLNLALNIVAKCGVVPWVLPEGMPDADFFVGLSYTQYRGDPESRLMGYANVFNRYGRWLFYSGNAQTFQYDERRQQLANLVESTLRRLKNLSETPHIYFHYSARFSHEDRESLLAAARTVRPQGTYSFVWINRHHPIRLYDERPETDGSLARGTYVVTSKNQLYLSTTGYNPYRKTLGTPQPLELTVWSYPPGQVRTPPDLHALARQILALTKLNWASSDALTGEPITTKYAGDIAYLTAAFLRQGTTFQLHSALERTPWFL
jgi:predicted HTH transcriptional regulator